VRQREEDAIEVRQTLEIRGGLLEAQFGQPVQVPVDFADGLARMLVGRDERDLRVRMKEQDAQKLRPAVARPAENA
jgi:hypothetical protein